MAVVLLAVAWAPVLIFLHELGHALAALALTDGEVQIGMKGRPWTVLAGQCTYDPSRLRRPRAEAWIAAAGPAASLAATVALGLGAVRSGFSVVEASPTGKVLTIGAVCALAQFLLSALPIRYGAGLGEPGAESDGRAIWRILRGAPPGGMAWAERKLRRTELTALAAFVVILALAGVVPLSTLLVLLGLFGAALWLQSREGRG